MMAANKKMLDQEPSEIEMLLPWHAAGTLNARDARRVEEALARDPELAKQFEVIRDEFAQTIHLNESLGAPSARAMQKLFAAIDAEPQHKPTMSSRISAGISAFFAKLSPRTLAWSASLGAIALLLQAGVIGAVLMKGEPASFQTASLEMTDHDAPITRDFGGAVAAPPRMLVRFTPSAKISDITALLDSYQASILGAKGGLFRVQLGNSVMGKSDVAALIAKLQKEKIVSFAAETP
ncbi:hypothetical protein [Bradyrhizobium lablabi]|uniref:hypothetical protein n=1 Tax=Bradyrhizobium lablabi TaxID=722472 RepID=UPI001BA53008|nr:hypothetical protein [Bradyrhizobium lablabi]MBR0694670.1 hypothetical protein [Bradyrhizobium lablabi]